MRETDTDWEAVLLTMTDEEFTAFMAWIMGETNE
jgi:hypothetical protein